MLEVIKCVFLLTTVAGMVTNQLWMVTPGVIFFVCGAMHELAQEIQELEG